MGNLIRGPFTEPESEDEAYDRWRQEMDDNAMKAAEERFEAWWAGQFGAQAEHGKFRAAMAYLAADAEATKRTAQRCVEICCEQDYKHTSAFDGAFTHNEAKDIAQAIAKEFGL